MQSQKSFFLLFIILYIPSKTNGMKINAVYSPTAPLA